jgi:hypothetical protein
VEGLEICQPKQLRYVFGEVGAGIEVQVVVFGVRFLHCRKTVRKEALSFASARAFAAGAAVQMA